MNSSVIKLARKTLLLMLLGVSYHSFSQTILLSEGFEAGYPSPGWTVQGYTPGGNNWIQYSYDVYSGNYSAAAFPNVTNGNSWLFTPGQILTAGKKYVLKYYAKLHSTAVLRTHIKLIPDYNSPSVQVRSSFPGSTLSFVLVEDTIVCETSGTYYIGFQNSSPNSSTNGTLIDEFSFTELSQLNNCSTVNAGTISSSNSTACPGAALTLSVSGLTTNSTGIRYAWQKSLDGTTWTNITNGFTPPYQLQVTHITPAFYRLTDTCTVSGASAVSNTLQINDAPFSNCYCTVNNLACYSLNITNVTIPGSTINNTSGCPVSGYTNFTTAGSATTYRGLSFQIQLAVSNGTGIPYSIGAWLDINHNGSFDEQELQTISGLTGVSNMLQYAVPINAITGETRLRIKIKYFNPNIPVISWTEACGDAYYVGEAEDYKIIISDAPSCSGPVSAGTISAPATICPNSFFSISATGTTTNQGQMKYAWQQSTDGTSWSNINNTTYLVNPLSISQNSNRYYRLTDTCIASGQSSVSPPVQVTTSSIFTCYCVPASSVCNTYGIDSVSIGSITNGSVCSTGGYGNYSSIGTTIDNGTLVPVYIRFRPGSVTRYVWVMLDINRNGTFENTERLFSGITSQGFISGTLKIPFNCSAGETGLRVLVSNSSFYPGPCSTGGTGEIEDYKVTLNLTSPVTNRFSFYIKQGAPTGGNGLSWATALSNIQSALLVATTGDTIKVAKGVYTAGTSNTNTYSLRDSLVLLGGYPNTGNPGNTDRNISSNQTILSGEIGTSAQTDNTRTILTINNVKGALVDGFIIENGYEGYYETRGPVYINNSNIIISRCVIRNNFNGTYGCGFNIQNSVLQSLNNIFENNTATWVDSVAAVLNIQQGSVVTAVNNIIAKNKSSFVINLADSDLKLLNSTLFKNYGYSRIHDTSSLLLQNSILYQNAGAFITDTSEFYKDVYSTITVSNSITEIYNYINPGYNGQNPRFTDSLHIAGADNMYFTPDDGLTLLNPCSPAINTGNNEFISGLSFDITGRPRIKNGFTDLGAYEVQETQAPPAQVLYVKKSATGLNNGSSWANAFTDLQSAFSVCSDTIKVAAGSYPVSLTDVNATYQLSNNRVVIGGYPENGNGVADPEANPTIIDGTVNSTQRVKILVLSINNDSTAKISGFRLINAAHPDYTTTRNPASIKVGYKSSARFENIKLDASKSYAYNTLHIHSGSSPVFYKSVFYNVITNQSQLSEKRDILIRNGSNPSFIRCFFGKDSTSAQTGILGMPVTINQSSGVFDSCYFLRATANAIYNTGSNPLIKNTVFRKTNGRSIYNSGSYPLVKNCQFADTTYSYEYSGGTVNNMDNSDAVYDHCEFKNSYTYAKGAVSYNENSKVVYRSCFFNAPGGDQSGTSAIANKNSEVRIDNCVGFIKYFTDNTNLYYNGTFVTNEGSSALTVVNSTLIGNTVIALPLINSASGSTVKVYNSILWRYGSGLMNTASVNDIITSDNTNPAICDIQNSILFKQDHGNRINSTSGVNPRLRDLSTATGPDGVLFSADDGYIPCDCSAAINSGNNIFNQLPVDILSAGRIYNGTIDRGAYELQSGNVSSKVYYVKPGTINGNGSSWANAHNNLQKAIQNNCADTIKVAKGVYKPSSSERDSSFNIYTGITLLGGYPDSGNPGEADRNPVLYPTILSGDIGIQNDSADNSYSVVRVHCPDTTVILDGLVIESGNSNSTSGPASGGGGILAIGNRKLNINNCIIRKNYASNGGGLFSTNSNVFLKKTVITNNTSGAYGGGFYLHDVYMVVNGLPWGPEFRMVNSVVSHNTGSGGVIAGTDVIVNRSNISIDNSVFYKNESYTGAGLRITGQPYLTIKNSAFVSNNVTTNSLGAGIHCSNSYIQGELNVKVFNSVFRDNTLMNTPNNYTNLDMLWYNGGSGETIPWYNMRNCATNSATTSGFSYNIPNSWADFVNVSNGAGADNLWFTADDGLQAAACSRTIDAGNNELLGTLDKDIRDSVRIKNNVVDMGPYESTRFSVTISASDSLICAGESVTFTAVTESAGAGPSYTWTVNGTPAGSNSNTFTTSALNNNDIVMLKVKRQDCAVNDTAYSNAIVMHVGNSLTPQATITATDTVICAGNPVTFTAAVTRDNNNTSYQWKVNGINTGTNSATFTSNLLGNNNTVQVTVVVNATCLVSQNAQSNIITMRVNPSLTPLVSITSDNNPSCAGGQVNFTATSINGGFSPAYQWKINGNNQGANGPSFSTTSLAANDLVTVVMTSNEVCLSSSSATSNSITHHTNTQVQPVVTISSTSMTCPQIPVTFTATPVNGGSSPLYQWRRNGINTGLNSNQYTSQELNQGDIIDVVLTSNESCINSATAASNTVPVNFSSGATPSISITASQTSICTGGSITFTALPVNTGTATSYQWLINGNNAGTNSTAFTSSTLSNNDQVKVVLRTTNGCNQSFAINSNVITVTVSPIVAPGVTIAASQTTICTGSGVTFTATPVNGGSAPVFQWLLNGSNTGTNSPVYTSSSLNNNDQIKVIMTGSVPCINPVTATSNIITITVGNAVAPAITLSGNTSVTSGQATLISSSISNGGTAPAYRWQDSTSVHSWQDIVGATGATLNYTPANSGDKIRSILTSNAGCVSPTQVTSNILSFTVSPVTAVDPVPANRYGIRFYPNPVQDYLVVDSLKLSDKWYSFKLYSAESGVLINEFTISNRNAITINTYSLPGGLYIAVLYRKNGIPVYYKFVKQ